MSRHYARIGRMETCEKAFPIAPAEALSVSLARRPDGPPRRLT